MTFGQTLTDKQCFSGSVEFCKSEKRGRREDRDNVFPMGSLFRSGPSSPSVEQRIEVAEGLFKHSLLDPSLLRNSLKELDLGLKDYPGNHDLLRKKADLIVLTLDRHGKRLETTPSGAELAGSAREILDSILTLSPRCGRTYLSRAKLNLATGNKEEGEIDLEKALRHLSSSSEQAEYREAQELQKMLA